MIAELTKLIADYYKWCDKEQKRIAKETKNPIAAVERSFDGFYQWLQMDEKSKK